MSKLDSDSDRARQLRSGVDPHGVKVGEEQTYLLNVDKPLVLPTNVKVRFVITADDVIHAWWVPALGWKGRRDSRNHQRGLDADRAAGHVPRPVRRVVRSGPRLHADRRGGQAQGGIRAVARRPGQAANAAQNAPAAAQAPVAAPQG